MRCRGRRGPSTYQPSVHQSSISTAATSPIGDPSILRSCVTNVRHCSEWFPIHIMTYGDRIIEIHPSPLVTDVGQSATFFFPGVERHLSPEYSLSFSGRPLNLNLPSWLRVVNLSVAHLEAEELIRRGKNRPQYSNRHETIASCVVVGSTRHATCGTSHSAWA